MDQFNTPLFIITLLLEFGSGIDGIWGTGEIIVLVLM